MLERLASRLALGLLVVAATVGVARADDNGVTGKIIVGYQGWFGCPGDFGDNKSWIHWFKNDVPDAAHLRIEYLPDVSEYPKESLCATSLKRADGTPIMLYSSVNPGVVDLHFRWMAQYGIDGAAVQRFIGVTTDPKMRDRFDQLLKEEAAAAAAAGRVFFVTYDISGGNPDTVTDDVARDWQHLVTDLKITSSPAYLRDHGRPMLEVWGFGFSDRPGRPQQVSTLLQTLKAGTATVPATSLIGGVSPGWRTLDGAARSDPEWVGIYRMFDVISPWFSGRFSSESQAQEFLRVHVPADLEQTSANGQTYMPVVFPGFSWSNLSRLNPGARPGALNQIPRLCGDFLWTQIREDLGLGVRSLYVGMFDEVDEGTAIYKLETSPVQSPAGTTTLTLSQDGCRLPSDFYLREVGVAARYLRSAERVPPRLEDAMPR
jgi:hypothetical protein